MLFFAHDSLDKTFQHALILLSISGLHFTHFSSCTVGFNTSSSNVAKHVLQQDFFPAHGFHMYCDNFVFLWALNSVNTFISVQNTSLLCALHIADRERLYSIHL